MAFRLMSDFPHIEYIMSYEMLQKKNWNYNIVAADLRVEMDKLKQEEADQGQKIMKVVEQCPDIMDFDQIRIDLIANNWNVQAVIEQYKTRNVYELLLINCANPQNKHTLSLHKTVAGMSIIEHLVAVQPLIHNSAGAAYNIYRD